MDCACVGPVDAVPKATAPTPIAAPCLIKLRRSRPFLSSLDAESPTFFLDMLAPPLSGYPLPLTDESLRAGLGGGNAPRQPGRCHAPPSASALLTVAPVAKQSRLSDRGRRERNVGSDDVATPFWRRAQSVRRMSGKVRRLDRHVAAAGVLWPARSQPSAPCSEVDGMSPLPRVEPLHVGDVLTLNAAGYRV